MNEILSIDLDFILEPCIQLYNDLINSDCPNQNIMWEDIMKKKSFFCQRVSLQKEKKGSYFPMQGNFTFEDIDLIVFNNQQEEIEKNNLKKNIKKSYKTDSDKDTYVLPEGFNPSNELW